MVKIGLTGGIGSGKSTVSTVFNALGVPVYEADSNARRLMESDKDIIKLLPEIFSKDVFLNGKLNKKLLATIVFNDKNSLKKLNSIVHPVVQEDFSKWSQQYLLYPYVIEEAALLFESGSSEKMDYIIFVKSKLQTRMQRVIERDNLSRAEVELRINNQLDDRIKEKKADFIINNEIDSMILPQIVDLHERILKIKK